MLTVLTPGSGRTVRRRVRLYRLAVRLLSIALLPLALVVVPHRARHIACRWALAARFPAERLDGLAPAARWLERYGWRYHLYRVYDNEWWHFEYRPDGRPPRLPNPGASVAPGPCAILEDAG